MSAKAALGDLTLRCAVEGQSHVFQLVDRVHRLLAHEFDRVLVAQIIASFDRVEGVPLGTIFFLAAQRRAHAALRGAGVRTHGIEFTQHGSLGASGCIQGSHQSRPAGADDHDFVLMLHQSPSPLGNQLAHEARITNIATTMLPSQRTSSVTRSILTNNGGVM